MAIAHHFGQKQMILIKKLKFFCQNRRIFDNRAVFKRLKSHDESAGGTNIWYQNVCKDFKLQLCVKISIGRVEAKPSGQFCKKSTLETPPGDGKSFIMKFIFFQY